MSDYLGDVRSELKCNKRKEQIIEKLKLIPNLSTKKASEICLVNHIMNEAESVVVQRDCIDKCALVIDILNEVCKPAMTPIERENALKTIQYIHSNKLIVKYDVMYRMTKFVTRMFRSQSKNK